MNYSDDKQEPILSRPLVSSNTQVVSRLLNVTANTGLVTAIFVDREFGGSGHFLNIMVPLYGSPDDDEALKMASAMSYNSFCTVQIVRIESASKILTKEANEVRLDVDNHSIDSDNGHLTVCDLPEDNQVLVQTYFPHRVLSDNKRINRRPANQPATVIVAGAEVGDAVFVHVVATLQDAIGLSKAVLGSRDLLVLGRGSTAKQGHQSAAASTYAPEQLGSNQHTMHRMSAQGLSTAFQLHASSNSPGLQLQSLPTGFTMSTAGTPTHPIDNPLGGESSGLRPRHHLRTHPSSRDLHHSSMTVSTILGLVSQKYLSSEVACCLLVVQSGASRAEDVSSVIPGSLRNSVHIVESAIKPRGHSRPLGFENEHSSVPHEHKN